MKTVRFAKTLAPTDEPTGIKNQEYSHHPYLRENIKTHMFILYELLNLCLTGK